MSQFTALEEELNTLSHPGAVVSTGKTSHRIKGTALAILQGNNKLQTSTTSSHLTFFSCTHFFHADYLDKHPGQVPSPRVRHALAAEVQVAKSNIAFSRRETYMQIARKYREMNTSRQLTFIIGSGDVSRRWRWRRLHCMIVVSRQIQLYKAVGRPNKEIKVLSASYIYIKNRKIQHSSCHFVSRFPNPHGRRIKASRSSQPGPAEPRCGDYELLVESPQGQSRRYRYLATLETSISQPSHTSSHARKHRNA